MRKPCLFGRCSEGCGILLATIVFSSIWFSCSGLAAPPPAMVRTKLQVPPSLANGIFGQDRYLNVPPGFRISLFATVPGARLMARAPNGDILVSQPGSGKITLLRPDATGSLAESYTYASGMASPHSLVFHTIGSTTFLYVGEATQVSRFVYVAGDTAAHDQQVVVTGLPGGGNHPLKSVALDGNDNLYVAIASSCNVCASDTLSSPQRGAIYVYNADGSGGRLFAQGLRNAEGLDFLPGTNQLWAVVNNRDDMPYPAQDGSGQYGKVLTSFVDNNPPDLLTPVRDGGNYGWPYCDSNPDGGLVRMPFSQDYDTNRDGHVNCAGMDIPEMGIQAHSAPLGMAFLQSSVFAAPYRNGVVTGLHGSWDRSVPTGYKVIWLPFSENHPGAAVDLVTGWLDPVTLKAWGRPVGAMPDGSGDLLISDDTAGAIYRLTYAPAAVSAASGFALLAPGEIASIYGVGLASQTASAASPDLPMTLGGSSVTVVDSHNVSRAARLAYVSTNQINFEIPAGTATGDANLMVQNATGSHNAGTVTIVAVAPALFSANGNGVGAAAATAIRQIIPSNQQSPVAVYSCDPSLPGSCVTVPIALGVDTPIYVSFFGTGFRGFSDVSNVHLTIGGVDASVLYAGPQGTFPGLDQVNVGLPLNLRGAGEVDVVLTVDGQSSNPVRIAIQ